MRCYQSLIQFAGTTLVLKASLSWGSFAGAEPPSRPLNGSSRLIADIQQPKANGIIRPTTTGRPLSLSSRSMAGLEREAVIIPTLGGCQLYVPVFMPDQGFLSRQLIKIGTSTVDRQTKR